MASWTPSVVSPVAGAERVTLGHRLVDDYLEVVRARWRRNTLWAAAYDLKVFFTVVDRDPVEVTVADVLGFIRTQRGAGAGVVVRLTDGISRIALAALGMARVTRLRASVASDYRSGSRPCALLRAVLCAPFGGRWARSALGGSARGCPTCEDVRTWSTEGAPRP